MEPMYPALESEIKDTVPRDWRNAAALRNRSDVEPRAR